MNSMPQSMNLSSTLASEGGFWLNTWMREPASTAEGRGTDVIWMWLFWFCVAWFVVLMVLMFYFVVKYRRGKVGPVAPVSPAHNTPIEIIWTVVPSISLVFMFFFGFWSYLDKVMSPGDAFEVNVTGAKWNWSLVYPDGSESISSKRIGAMPDGVPVFYMPAERAIRLKMISTDVMHAFWVPDFRIKQDVLPNRYMSVWFRADKPSGENRLTSADVGAGFESLIGAPYSDHWVFCAAYCGELHSEMYAIIRVVDDDVFRRWQTTLADVLINKSSPADIGKIVHKQKCASCHSVDGSANTGPTWKDLYGETHKYTDGASILADDNHIRESIRIPAKHVREGFPNSMTPFDVSQVSEKQMFGVIAYMKTLSKHVSDAEKADLMKKPEPGAAPAGGTTPPSTGAAPAATSGGGAGGAKQ